MNSLADLIRPRYPLDEGGQGSDPLLSALAQALGPNADLRQIMSMTPMMQRAHGQLGGDLRQVYRQRMRDMARLPGPGVDDGPVDETILGNRGTVRYKGG